MHRILINGLQLGNKNTGVQYYTENLYNFLRRNNTDYFEIQLFRYSSLNIQNNENNRLKRIYIENYLLPNFLKGNVYNLYHSPNYVLPYFLKCPSILTIHDLITLDYPELCQSESVLYFGLLLARSIKKATKIIAVSNSVKEDILRHFDVSEKKIEVVYHGINSIFKRIINKAILKKFGLPEKYILFVGNIEPKKNLERLIRAFNLFRTLYETNYKLVIVGGKGWKCKNVFETVVELKISREIIFTGYVQLEELPAIYSQASAFVFPSLYEGFGIPPLEAMACEVPVLVSNRGALPEITGGNCLQVNPYDINEIAKGIYTVLMDENLRKRQVDNGRMWVMQFTWERAAEETLKVYEKALSNPDYTVCN